MYAITSMKKRLSLLVISLMLIFVSVAHAEDFLSDKTKYFKYHSTEKYEFFFMKNSFKSIKKGPPFYIIEGILIVSDYARSEILGTVNRYYYDDDKQIIEVQIGEYLRYNGEGKIISREKRPKETYLITPDKIGAVVSNVAFSEIYGRPFYKAWQKKTKN